MLVQWMASAQKPADLQVTAVSTAYNTAPDNSPASAWLKRENWPTPVMADSSDNTAANAYGLTAFPYLVVLGPDGTVKARTTGELTPDQLTSFVNKALSTDGRDRARASRSAPARDQPASVESTRFAAAGDSFGDEAAATLQAITRAPTSCGVGAACHRAG